MLNLVFGRYFGFAKCRGPGVVKGVGRGLLRLGKVCFALVRPLNTPALQATVMQSIESQTYPYKRAKKK